MYKSLRRHVINGYPLIKELGFFCIIFAQTFTAYNVCLTHMAPSILIYANALGYILSIKVGFVIRNIMSIYLRCCMWKGGGGSKKYSFKKIEKDG